MTLKKKTNQSFLKFNLPVNVTSKFKFLRLENFGNDTKNSQIKKIVNTKKNYRCVVLQILILGAFLTVVFRLVQIQVFNSDKYKALAKEQQMNVTNVIAKRGSIYTSDNYPVASTTTKYYININFNKITNFDKSIETVLDEFQIDKSKIDEFKKQSKNKVFSSEINLEQKQKLEKKLLNKNPEHSAISISSKIERFYPEKKMLAHTLGIVGKKLDGENTGYFGLEQKYNGDLQGQNGADFQVKSASGSPILHGAFDKISAKNGSDLYLTINRDVQYIIETSLEIGVEKYNAKTGTVIVMDPKTGAVIALAGYPTFDPSVSVENLDSLVNYSISRLYEPGSIMKPITIASGLMDKKIDLTTTYNDTGPRVYSGYTIDNWDGKHHGVETITSTLQHSNNMATAYFGLKLGGEKLSEYFSKFGFGKKSGIDLEGEESGIFDSTKKLGEIEVANYSFGQGIAVTPIQMVAAYAAIANGGTLMRPYIVSKLVTADRIIETKPYAVESVISKEVSDIMIDQLNKAVNGGEAKFFVSKKFNISGKTGTAQIPIKGGYDPTKTNASFIGFFTKYKDFVMLVKLEEPTFPSGYAAETAVPLWMTIAEKMAGYYGLIPDRI